MVRLITLLSLALLSTGVQARQPIFFSLYGGGADFNADFDFVQPLQLDLEEDGDTIGLGVGYEVYGNWVVQLDYTYTDADDVTVDEVVLSLNYHVPFLIENMSATFGVVAGLGSLEWDDEPDIAEPVNSDTDADQSLFGVKLGLTYDISERWSTSLSYQYYDQEFDTHVTAEDLGRANFSHDEFQFILFGLHYHL